ncbi:MAG: hypothetical protein D6737_14885 [Chloroflexi bacterium]|nr:MAG: hypothetical protein D6737_14885 [Chloroflexota bacterium]
MERPPALGISSTTITTYWIYARRLQVGGRKLAVGQKNVCVGIALPSAGQQLSGQLHPDYDRLSGKADLLRHPSVCQRSRKERQPVAARPNRIAAIVLVGLVALGIIIAGHQIRNSRLSKTTSPAELFANGEIRIGVDASFPPFAFVNDDELVGIDIDLGRAIGEALGMPVRFVNMGFDGLYDSLKANQVDILISALLVDPLRQDNVLYTRSYFDAGLVLVSNPDNVIEDMGELSGHVLAYEFGSSADSEARRWLRRIHPFEIHPYERPEYAMDAVRLGQADAALVDAISARLYLREYNDTWDAQIHYVTESIFAIATRRDRPDQWRVVNRALQTLFEDGRLDTILNRWL